MKISSHNEWSPLKSVVVGSAAGANKPDGCHFDKPGAYPGHVTAQADMDLDRFVRTLEQEGVKVHRPKYNNFAISGGMYNYCPRDRLLIVGDTVVDCNMQYNCRLQESHYIDFVLGSAKHVITAPRNRWVRFDAANVWGVDYDSSINDSNKIRSSVGVGLDWLTPVGPLSFSLATPLTKADTDIEETFRFNLGTTF